MDVMFFGQVYAPIAMMLAEDLVVAVKGRVQRRDDGSVSLSAMELTIPELSDGPGGPVRITLPAFKATEQVMGQLADVLRTHEGSSEVRLSLVGQRATQEFQLGPQFRVSPNPALFGGLKILLGPACLG